MKTIHMIPAYETNVGTICLHNDAAAMKQRTLTVQNMADVIQYSEERIRCAQKDMTALVDSINRITSLVEGIAAMHEEMQRVPSRVACGREGKTTVFVQQDWIAEAALYLKNLTSRLAS